MPNASPTIIPMLMLSLFPLAPLGYLTHCWTARIAMPVKIKAMKMSVGCMVTYLY